MIRRVTLGAAALILGFAGPAAAGERPKAVIELFTSQGCSSCPAADKLLTGLVDEPDLIALSLPVDYWDYLGWKDTLASPANTDRQRAYAAARGSRKVYTPQVVANGLTRAVGSNREAIESAIIAADPGGTTLIADARIAVQGHTVTVEIGSAEPNDADVLLLRVARSVAVTINRGENAGRKGTYSNVVRKIEKIGRWTGATIVIKKTGVDLAPGETVAVLVQSRNDGRLGPVLAAAMAERLMSPSAEAVAPHEQR